MLLLFSPFCFTHTHTQKKHTNASMSPCLHLSECSCGGIEGKFSPTWYAPVKWIYVLHLYQVKGLEPEPEGIRRENGGLEHYSLACIIHRSLLLYRTSLLPVLSDCQIFPISSEWRWYMKHGTKWLRAITHIKRPSIRAPQWAVSIYSQKWGLSWWLCYQSSRVLYPSPSDVRCSRCDFGYIWIQ